jgi:Transglycosylase
MKRILLIIFLSFAFLGLGLGWYIPKKIKQIAISKIKRIAKSKGVDIEDMDIQISWSSIKIENIKLKGKDWKSNIKQVVVENYKVHSILPLEVTLGDIIVDGVDFAGKLPEIPKLTHKHSSGGKIKWHKIVLKNMSLDIYTKLGNTNIEYGEGVYEPELGGKFVFEKVSLKSDKIPVYYIGKIGVIVDKNKHVESVNLHELIWKISEQFKFYTEKAQIKPKGKDKLEYIIKGKFLDNKGEFLAEGIYCRKKKSLKSKMEISGAKIGYIFPQKIPLLKREKLTLNGKFSFELHKEKIKGKMNGDLNNLSFFHKLISDSPIRNINLKFNTEGELDRKTKSFNIPYLKMKYKNLKSNLIVKAENWGSKKQKLQIRLKIPKTKCQTVLNSIPKPILPHISQFKLTGNFSSDLKVKIDFSNLTKKGVHVGGSLNMNGCKVKKAPPFFRASKLRTNFEILMKEPGGQKIFVDLSEDSDWFTPLDKISPYMIKAVLTTEDGRFYRHKGFIVPEFSTALARNIKAKKFKFGASSITMQLVKNVFLKRKKTISRKLEELFLTWYVERHVKKSRLMEIYLNLIELGPDIYGVTQASRQFFGKDPIDLTIKESIYLASILPSPKKRYKYFCRGKISKFWNKVLNRLILIMKKRRKISSEEYEEAIASEIVFDQTDFQGKWRCYKKIKKFRRKRKTRKTGKKRRKN